MNKLDTFFPDLNKKTLRKFSLLIWAQSINILKNPSNQFAELFDSLLHR